MANTRTTKKTAKAKETTSESDQATAEAGAENVDKIRDILFGGQMRDFDRRFKRLEEKLEREKSQFQDDMDSHYANVEQQMRELADSLSESLDKERQERIAALEDMARRLESQEKNLTGNLDAMKDFTAKEFKAVRQQLQEQAKAAQDALREQREQLIDLLDKESQQLHDEKVSRDSLSDMLLEVSLRLKGEFDIDSLGGS